LAADVYGAVVIVLAMASLLVMMRSGRASHVSPS
jgi:hypothetical protein